MIDVKHDTCNSTHLHDETAHVYTMTLLHLSADDETVTHDL